MLLLDIDGDANNKQRHCSQFLTRRFSSTLHIDILHQTFTSIDSNIQTADILLCPFQVPVNYLKLRKFDRQSLDLGLVRKG